MPIGESGISSRMGAAAKENARKHLIEDHWQEWVNAYKMLFPTDWTYQ